MADKSRRSLRQYASFETTRKGYAPKQVDAFLAELEGAFRELEDLLRESQGKVRKLELEVNHDQGKTPGGAEGDEIIARAEMQARVTIDEAQAKANEILATAEAQALRLLAEARDGVDHIRAEQTPGQEEGPPTTEEQPSGPARREAPEALEQPKPTGAEVEANVPQSEGRRSSKERRRRRDDGWTPTTEFDEVASQLEVMAGRLVDPEYDEESTAADPRSPTDETEAPTRPDSGGPEARADSGEPSGYSDAIGVAGEDEYSQEGPTDFDRVDIRQMLAAMSEPPQAARSGVGESSRPTEVARSAISWVLEPRQGEGRVPQDSDADETKPAAQG